MRTKTTLSNKTATAASFGAAGSASRYSIAKYSMFARGGQMRRNAPHLDGEGLSNGHRMIEAVCNDLARAVPKRRHAAATVVGGIRLLR